MPWLLLIIKAYIVYIEFCIRHSEGPISRPVTFGGQCGGPRPLFRASLSRKCPGITAWFRLDSGTNQFKAGKYVEGLGI